MTMANSGVPYPVRVSGGIPTLVTLPGVPLGSFFGVSYDEVSFPLSPGDVFVFSSDGVTEAMNSLGEEYTSERLLDVVTAARDLPARGIVDAIVRSVEEHRGGHPPNDDTTVVVVRITA
jgi:sigma-B regulation protein RsbU (phosphoserine phosphatase)